VGGSRPRRRAASRLTPGVPRRSRPAPRGVARPEAASPDAPRAAPSRGRPSRSRPAVPRPRLPRLMLVTDRHATRGRDLVRVVAAAVAGGAALVQVRERDLPEAALERLLRRLGARLRGRRVRLLVNGAPALARRLRIGLHLPAAAPLPAGPRPALYGRAVHDEAEAQRALGEGAAYVVVGPVFPTGSKPGHPGIGLAGLAALARTVAPVPVFAIGGITPARVPAVIDAGAFGVAVRSGILAAAAPRAAAAAFRAALAAAAC
jgi:thiamine-phosphate diphosphorylase